MESVGLFHAENLTDKLHTIGDSERGRKRGKHGGINEVTRTCTPPFPLQTQQNTMIQ
jgi:hypothetical protein